jgi:hypothetical protein
MTVNQMSVGSENMKHGQPQTQHKDNNSEAYLYMYNSNNKKIKCILYTMLYVGNEIK